MKAQVSWNEKKQKYEMKVKNQVIASSKTQGYFTYLVVKQTHAKILKYGIKEIEVVSTNPAEFKVLDQSGNAVQSSSVVSVPTSLVQRPQFSINDRFSFMEQLITMVINKTAKSIFVSGEGGVGKTFSVIDCLRRAGKIDYASVVPTIANLDIVPEDDEKQISEKINAQMDRNLGDYVVIKGHSSAASLYRILYEHRDRTIVFDDCDSILKDGTSLSLLKAALDSYEDRWVSWRVERGFGDSDLPTCFKFNGSIIFISNLPIHKIDDAVKTRCFKVDLSMTKPQRIERMRAVIHNVLPDVDLSHKTEVLDFLNEHLHLTDDINFRTLMNLIMIKHDESVPCWKTLCKFALTEQ